MKVLAVNGSPRPDGNTSHMIKAVLSKISEAGIETEFYQAGGKPVLGCKACMACWKTHKGKCMQNDWMNELYMKMEEADCIILGSPTYFGDLTCEMKAVLDRCGYIARGNGKDGASSAFSRKIGAAVCAVRRCGGMHTLDSMNHFFFINDMIVPGSSYWNMSLSRLPGEYEEDEEGVETIERLAENIVWLLEKLRG